MAFIHRYLTKDFETKNVQPGLVMHSSIGRFVLLSWVLVLSGCNNTPNPGSNNILFQQIEGAVEDIKMNVSSKYYSGDLGDDRLGMALATFEKSVAGTPLEADLKKLSAKVTEVSTLAAKRPKIEKLRTAVDELAEAVAEFKKKL